MRLEVKPAVATFAAGMCLTVSVGVSSQPHDSVRVEENNAERSDSLTAAFGGATMSSQIVAPTSQDYYWTPAWQEEEAQALRELERGDYLEFDDVADLIKWLDEPEA